MRITFLGAAGTVTGSRYLVESDKARVLVDCGLFQGVKSVRLRNREPIPIDVARLDAVVLTHAHIDHTGYVPALCKLGFKGPVYCTDGTRDLLGILLPDSGHLQEEDARHANQYGYSRHRPARPLYTRVDAERSLAQLVPVGFHEAFEPAPGFEARYSRAGHILGSGCLSLRVGGTRITFSGDVGRPADPIMRPPEPLSETDYLVVESTYGNRLHPRDDILAELAEIVVGTVERHGTVVIPAFAVGRAQHILFLLSELREQGRIPEVPVFLDSPMAISATEMFYRHPEDHRLSRAQARAMGEVASYANRPEQSKAIDARTEPAIVISASGMATGGRVLHHLKRFLPDARNAVLIVGFQAAGTRGEALLGGAGEVKIHGQYVPVNAQISHIQGLSAHGDYAELVGWLRDARLSPRRVFVTHGEPAAADAFRRRLSDRFGWSVSVPEQGESSLLGPAERGPRRARRHEARALG